MIICQRNALGAEGICLDNIRPGLQIFRMYSFDHIRAGNIQQVIVAFKVGFMLTEPLATKIFLGQLVPLYHRAHCPVNYQDAFL